MISMHKTEWSSSKVPISVASMRVTELLLFSLQMAPQKSDTTYHFTFFFDGCLNGEP
jgi:hypothetical protein